ncbi:putative Ribonuclease H1 [Hypsibius exemplaris]|uniref:Ribonuclease H1 n=1 Tax=Hypsibius exemplaris TaxID=2072580 RepID=A0A1W0WKK9_HYPEX|nr:putative Ribonuclease H1 [Hypsibius exemplaris]
MPKADRPVYAVRVGRKPGLYDTWDECKAQVESFSGAKYKKFKTTQDAQNFIDGIVAPEASKPQSPFPSGSSGAPGDASQFQRPHRSGHSNRSAPYPNRGNGKDSFLASTCASRQSSRHLSTVTGSASALTGIACTDSGKSAAATHLRVHDPENVAVVFTDGCCRNNGHAGAVAGIGVFWGNDSPHNIAEPLPGRPTNNRAEIHAAVKAIRQAKEMGKSKIIIHTDSQFVVNSVQLWIPSWIQNNWKLAGGGQVVNRADFEVLLEVMNGIEVDWIHVRGHQGVWGNEEADRLANEGSLMELPEEDCIPIIPATGRLAV